MIDYSQCTVLVVDDNKNNIEILINTLSDICEVSAALNGHDALALVKVSPPNLILLDLMMPEVDGFAVCRELKSDKQTSDIPVIFLTGMTDAQTKAKGFNLGAVDFITKPFEPLEIVARVKTHLALSISNRTLKQYNEILETKVQERTRELDLTQEVTIDTLATLAEYRDPETGGHILRTKSYVIALAEHIKSHPDFKPFLTDEAISLIGRSAPLHDIGKVGTPDCILLKPGKLTAEEFEIMKRHTTIGFNTLYRAEKKLGMKSFLNYAKEVAYTHHEKWDGSGYPRGLKGTDIPISGRLMALADVYDALISKRVYKPPFPHKKALSIIIEGKGSHFDPVLVDTFETIEEQIRLIALKFADYDEEREILSLSNSTVVHR
ncbi:MAG: two-component system response regulator [Fibrobacter sp.]|nr:two-component system response regulator [Fibrobacter sp.]